MELLAEKYNFPWDIIRHTCEGQSIIDTGNMGCNSLEDANNFVLAYGYDWDCPKDREFLQESYQQSLEFIQTQFIDTFSDNLKIPDVFIGLEDLRFLTMSSNPVFASKREQLWACAILKVLHTIIHLKNDVLEEYFHEARVQIFNRFNGHLYIDDAEKVYLGRDKRNLIPLYDFHVKKNKDWNSKIIKLLHKVENTSAGIYDCIGVRMVTNNMIELFQAFNYLLSAKIFTRANITPQRSRNNLIDLDAFQAFVSEQVTKYQNGLITMAELEKIFGDDFVRERFLFSADDNLKDNPNSLEGYRSIQFTCRHLIRLTRRSYQRFLYLQEKLKAVNVPANIMQEVEAMLANTAEEVRFLFPFEIQLMDKESFLENQFGDGSHSEYKHKQLIKARERVLGFLAKVSG